MTYLLHEKLSTKSHYSLKVFSYTDTLLNMNLGKGFQLKGKNLQLIGNGYKGNCG